MKRSFVLFALLVSLCGPLKAEEPPAPFLIVTDPWPPYAIQDPDSGEAKGIDVETAVAVLQTMGIKASVEFFPWKRCINMVRNQEADAILDISESAERREFLNFPGEPVSYGTTVLFKQRDKSIPFQDVSDLENYRVGAILGYEYCPEVDLRLESGQTVRNQSLEQNFGMLLADRLDIVIEVDAVGKYTLRNLHLGHQVDTIQGAQYCRGGNYLAFAKKPGMEQVAREFGEQLERFKSTDAYQAILRRYLEE